MELREQITLDGVPGIWTTNLADGELRDLYRQLVAEGAVDESGVEFFTQSGLGVHIRLMSKMVPFKEGYCQCIGFAPRYWAIYRSERDWTILAARKAEVQELREQQEVDLDVRKFLLEVQDNQLALEMHEDLRGGEPARAARALECRVQLRQQSSGLRLSPTDGPGLLNAGIAIYSAYPGVEDGIRYLLSAGAFGRQFVEFAKEFIRCHPEGSATAATEVEKVLNAAVARFPKDGLLHKEACLMMRRLGRLDVAMKYCELAIERGVSDYSKTGFTGRLARLRKEAAKSCAPRW